MEEDKIIEERKQKIVNFFKNNPTWIFVTVLIILFLLGLYIRYQPLTDHNGKPGLWDITTNDYTLGPDLDPFLFLRYAEAVVNNGSLPATDNMRNVPLGFDTTTELQMVSYSIVLTYKIINLFGTYSVNYAGAFMPVLAFGLTIIAFYLFVFEIFRRTKKEIDEENPELDEKENKRNLIKAGLIASISTLFMIILPGFLSRTVAGIPEKESVGFLFMFLSFWLFLKMWKAEKNIKSYIYGVLAGVSTALMGLTWGGVTYIYVTLGLSSLVLFILNRFNMRRIIGYGLWLISSLIVIMTFTHRFSIKQFVTGIDTGISCFVLAVLIIHFIIWNTKIKDFLKMENLKVPKTIITLIIMIVLGIVAIFIISPTAISEKISQLYHTLITPVTGRWNTTVAENAQPYFTQWVGNFGKAIFWLFFIGSVLLFNKMFNKLKKTDNYILTGLYVLFFFGLVFSRYSSHPALFDGENFISKFFYFGTALLLVAGIIYFYVKYHKENHSGFEKIEAEYILLFVLFVLTLFTARSAVRLIMVLIPIAPIFLSYLMVDLGYKIKTVKENLKLVMIIIFGIVLILSAYNGYQYYNSIKQQSYSYIPSYYTNQWQEAMSWVRANTSSDAIFAHWWDYGYWVQSIGNRATVTDGGNAIVWWNYLTGRYVLTGDNQKEALDVLWNHNATNLLIDSTDIGKYGAFSQIGSDANYDRLSSGPIAVISDPSQIRETKNQTIRTYYTPSDSGKVVVYPVEEDFEYTLNSTKKNFFRENTGFIGISLVYNQKNETVVFSQPEAMFISNNQQLKVPLRYLYWHNKLMDFKTGINAAVSVIEKVDSSDGRTLSFDNLGAAIYLSPRILRGLLGQLYILDNALGNFPGFKLIHSQKDFIIEQINNQGADLGDFVYYYGLRGPIKIWNITYTGNEKHNEDYVRKTVPDYITWKF